MGKKTQETEIPTLLNMPKVVTMENNLLSHSAMERSEHALNSPLEGTPEPDSARVQLYETKIFLF